MINSIKAWLTESRYSPQLAYPTPLILLVLFHDEKEKDIFLKVMLLS